MCSISMIIDKTNIHKFLKENKTILDCKDRNVTSLIIPYDTCEKLEEIDCSENKLTSLIIPEECISLKNINCSHNKISVLKLPDKIEGIMCYNNELEKLIVPRWCTILDCSSNNLINITISEGCDLLEEIWCENNNLTKLVIPKKCTSLKYLYTDDIETIFIQCKQKFEIYCDDYCKTNKYEYYKEKTKMYQNIKTLIQNLRPFSIP